ncbi:MAG: hypothetical protein KC544_11410 [Gemmatimonadetes bacterium]|nr:hypothetical protein [Gemmatimonadota bacterium]MCB9505146.1 hypothetical protein [Gemmatimonadales bacterium]MCB9518680.1 hypothetical protein [Gemmatimonadales bacterium]HPF61490.1 CbiX/SirB N-terminal domain-containing protein [Gemmatimonadales bacterium]HRX19058.1 CbiX/SirB N-terminal domain-containing protein [Gemmatimonadales bacterium]
MHGTVAAQFARVACPEPGLLVVAHGADSTWNARVREVMTMVDWDGPVELAFLMGPASRTDSWTAGVGRLAAHGARCAVAVPLMVSSHGAHVRQMRFYAGELDEMPAGLGGMDHGAHGTTGNAIPVSVTAALDGAPELGRILADRLAADGRASGDGPVVLVAHGPSGAADVAGWVEGLDAAIEPIRVTFPGRTLRIGLLRDDAEPAVRDSAVKSLRDLISSLARASGDSVTVLTVLVSSGEIDRIRVPADLAGMPMRYVGSVLAPHPELAGWITRIARAHRAAPPLTRPPAAPGGPSPR